MISFIWYIQLAVHAQGVGIIEVCLSGTRLTDSPDQAKVEPAGMKVHCVHLLLNDPYAAVAEASMGGTPSERFKAFPITELVGRKGLGGRLSAHDLLQWLVSLSASAEVEW